METSVTNQGTGLVHGSTGGGSAPVTGIQAGDRHEHRYGPLDGRDAHPTQLVETRDASNRTLGQYVWGVQYLGRAGAV